MKPHRKDISVTSRSVAGLNRKSWDANGIWNGIPYTVYGAHSRADAIDKAIAHIEYAQKEGSVETLGFKLSASGVNFWWLDFPNHSSHSFNSASLKSAIEYVAESYPDHRDIQEFCRAARQILDDRDAAAE